MFVVGCPENNTCLINRVRILLLLRRGYNCLCFSWPEQEEIVMNQGKDYNESAANVMPNA